MTTNPLPYCLACGSADLRPVIDLGSQPPANLLLDHPDDACPAYPLALVHCGKCGHGQLTHSVSPDELYRNYAYASGTSSTLGAYFDWFADEVTRRWPNGARVLEIASNDGSLLRRLQAHGHACVGVEPAANLFNECSDLTVVNGFWPLGYDLANKFDLIIAMNVLAHGPDPLSFLRAAGNCLAPGGRIIIQTSQADMIENGEFDTIYHEHHSFFTPNSMSQLAIHAGLALSGIRKVAVHGNSWVFILRDPRSYFMSASFLLSEPFCLPIHSLAERPERWAEFAEKATRRIATLQRVIANERKIVCFIGAAAKAIVVMHALGNAKPDLVFDEAPLKIGKYIPGIDRRIRPLSTIAEVDRPVLAVLSAWNYKDELTAKVKALRGDKPTEFMTYFPEVEKWG